MNLRKLVSTRPRKIAVGAVGVFAALAIIGSFLPDEPEPAQAAPKATHAPVHKVEATHKATPKPTTHKPKPTHKATPAPTHKATPKPKATHKAKPKAAPKVHDRIVFSVTGTGKPNIQYGSDSDNRSGNTHEGMVTGYSPLPWHGHMNYHSGQMYYQLTAQLSESGGNITCEVKRGATTIAKGHASGKYQICMAEATPFDGSGI